MGEHDFTDCHAADSTQGASTSCQETDSHTQTKNAASVDYAPRSI